MEGKAIQTDMETTYQEMKVSYFRRSVISCYTQSLILHTNMTLAIFTMLPWNIYNGLITLYVQYVYLVLLETLSYGPCFLAGVDIYFINL